MQKIPNLITAVRLLAALALATLSCLDRQLAASFFVCLVVAAGVSDMLDGFIARRFNWCSDFGAKLDSISDLSIYIAVLWFLEIDRGAELLKCQNLFFLGGMVQVSHLMLSVWRHGHFPAYHTTFSRVCAYLIFFGVLAFWLVHLPILPLLVAAWVACSLEGIAMTLILRQPANNLAWLGAAIARNDQNKRCEHKRSCHAGSN